jgi:predicted  nucleic acid-binding Zn-ribbon protein
LASHLITERSILIGRQRDRLLDLEDGVTELENRLVDTAERLENEKTLSTSLGQQLAAAREQLEDALTQIQQLQAAEQSLDTLQVSE